MAGKREKPEEIVSKLRQVEVLQGQGATIAEAVRQIGMTQQTFYRCRSLHGREVDEEHGFTRYYSRQATQNDDPRQEAALSVGQSEPPVPGARTEHAVGQ